MEIRLKASPSDTDTGIIVDEYGALWKFVDEYGALWKYSGPKRVHSLFLATAKGLGCEAVQGFYQNGTLFIVDVSDARKYFSSVNSNNCCDMPHTCTEL
jgi:hypothetical protein